MSRLIASLLGTAASLASAASLAAEARGLGAAAASSESQTVHFAPSEEGRSFRVVVDGGAACHVPCDLELSAGAHEVRVLGDATFSQRLVVDPGTRWVSIERWHGPGPWLLGLSAVAAVVGAVGASSKGVPCDVGEMTSCKEGEELDSVPQTLGKVLLVGAGIGAVTGALLTFAHRSQLVSGGSEEAAPARADLSGVWLAPAEHDGFAIGAAFRF